jgi:hypothetical protein
MTIVMTYPLAFRIARKLPRHDSDIWIFLWNDWWFREAVTHGLSPFRTPFLFYPTGASLAFHSNSFLQSAIDALLHPVLGLIGAYNTSTLLIFVVGAFGMYLLAHEVTGSRGAAFVAGAIYAFAPYHLSQALAHPHLACVQWYPYMILFLRRAMLRGSPLAAGGAGAMFALSLSSGLHLGTLGALLALFFALFTLATEPAARGPRPIAALALAGLVALLLSAPALVTPLRELRAVEGGVRAVHVAHEENYQTDLAALVLPSPYHPVFGALVEPAYARFERNSKWFPFLGYAVLVMAVAGAVRGGRRALFWWLSGAVWITLSLGDFLRCCGTLFPSIRLPFALLSPHLPFSILRSSDRFNALVPLSLGMLAAFALARVGARWKLALACGLVLFEYLQAPIPTGKPLEASPFLERMAAEPAGYAVVDLPMGYDASKRWLYLQTIHHKPLVEGHISRIPPHTYDFIDGIPLLRALRVPGAPPPADPAADLCGMARRGIRYILVHPELADPESLARWESWMPAEPVYRDDVLIVYATADGCATSAVAGCGASGAPHGEGAGG